MRWVASENLHLTLKFLGDVSQEKIPEIKLVLQKAVKQYGVLRLNAKGLGCFPNAARPSVIWIGLDGDMERLKLLAEQVENGLFEIGFPAENRPFSPHLTIGRVKAGHSAIGEAVQQFVLGEVAAWENDSIHLMQSTLKPSGAEYQALADFRLT